MSRRPWHFFTKRAGPFPLVRVADLVSLSALRTADMDSNSSSGLAHPAPVKHARGRDTSSLPSPPLTPPPFQTTSHTRQMNDLLERTASQSSTVARDDARVAHAVKSANWDMRIKELSCQQS